MHAKQEGKPFAITYEYFMHFARRTKYLELKGITGASLTVDRKNNLLGYVRGNIQALTRSRNSEKKVKQDAIRAREGFAWNGGNPPNKNGKSGTKSNRKTKT